MFNNGIELTDPQEIVNHFAIHFSDVFSSDNICDSFPVCDRESDIVSVLHNFVINTCDILDAVKKVNSNFTMGPDNVPAFLVKDCISCLCEPLCYLFNLIIAEAAYPNKWKSTKVIPVFKSGVRNNIENYRPIAIVSNFSKIFERIVANNLYSHVSNQLSPSQHGFIKGKSTSTNLCEYIQYISDSLESKKQVDVIYTDLSKAFDVVNHSILLDKLSKFGLCSNLIKLFQSFLCNRIQYVEYRGFRSQTYVTTSGVTQGSNLGPILFIIYFNDALLEFKCPIFVYADDLKVAKTITTLDDCYSLQNDLNNFIMLIEC